MHVVRVVVRGVRPAVVAEVEGEVAGEGFEVLVSTTAICCRCCAGGEGLHLDFILCIRMDGYVYLCPPFFFFSLSLYLRVLAKYGGKRVLLRNKMSLQFCSLVPR